MAYLDHAATTPMRPEVLAAYTAALAGAGNASSLHASGRRARRVVEESRESLAAVLGCRPSELVFTSGGWKSTHRLSPTGRPARHEPADLMPHLP